MDWKIWSILVVILCSYHIGCAAPEFFTVTIYDDPQRVVRLQR